MTSMDKNFTGHVLDYNMICWSGLCLSGHTNILGQPYLGMLGIHVDRFMKIQVGCTAGTVGMGRYHILSICLYRPLPISQCCWYWYCWTEQHISNFFYCQYGYWKMCRHADISNTDAGVGPSLYNVPKESVLLFQVKKSGHRKRIFVSRQLTRHTYFCSPPHEVRKGNYWIRHRPSVRSHQITRSWDCSLREIHHWLAASCREYTTLPIFVSNMDLHFLHTVGFYEPYQNPFVTKVARTWRGKSLYYQGGEH